MTTQISQEILSYFSRVTPLVVAWYVMQFLLPGGSRNRQRQKKYHWREPSHVPCLLGDKHPCVSPSKLCELTIYKHCGAIQSRTHFIASEFGDGQPSCVLHTVSIVDLLILTVKEKLPSSQTLNTITRPNETSAKKEIKPVLIERGLLHQRTPPSSPA